MRGETSKFIIKNIIYVNVEKSKLISRHFIAVTFAGEMLIRMLDVVWILFAMSFSDYSHLLLVILMIVRQIVRVFALLICSYFCDKFGFDKVICVTSAFVMLGMLLSCTAQSMVQFSIAILVDAMVGYETQIISFAYIIRISTVPIIYDYPGI